MNGTTLAHQARERIDCIADRWLLWSMLTGTVLAGWITLTVLMLAVAADMLFQFDGWTRGVVLAVWCGVSATSALVLMVRPLRRMRTTEGTARRLEEVFPRLDSDLINLVQLSRESKGASKLLREGALRQAGRHVAEVSLESAAGQLTLRDRFRLCMNTPRDLAAAIGICLVIVVIGGTGHVLFPAWPNAVHRLFHPGRFIPAVGAVQIEKVLPGDVELLSGKSVSITAIIRNPQGTEYAGIVVTVPDDGPEQRTPMIPSEKCDRYSLTFPHVTDSFRYRLEIGGTQSDFFSVRVFDRPVIRTISATYRFPEYTGLPEQTVELKAGAIDVPQFTNVRQTVTTNVPVDTATVELADRVVTGLVRKPYPKVRADFQVLRSGMYRVHLTDAYGNTNQQSGPFPIHVTIDDSPQIELTRPAPEMVAAAGETISLVARAEDDYGLSVVELRSRTDSAPAETEQVIQAWKHFRNPRQVRLRYNWKLPSDLKPGAVLLFRIVAKDRREATCNGTHYGPQESATSFRKVRIIDRAARFAGKLASLEKFRQQLWRIFKQQTDLRTRTTPMSVAKSLDAMRAPANAIRTGQDTVRKMTTKLSASIDPAQQSLAPFRMTLKNLADGRMTEAVRLSHAAATANQLGNLRRFSAGLVNVQDDILDVLRRLLEVARNESASALAQMEHRPGGDLPDDVVGRLKDLNDALKKFLKAQRKVVEASQELAKKPVEDFTDADKQKLKELAAAEDKWSRFLTEKYNELAKLPDQDFSNGSMLQELIEVVTEIKMAKDALTKKSVEIAVPLEQLGAEMAEEMTTNIEKWLPDTPDREKWSQEEPLTDAMREAPMAELPHELEDIVGELMEDEEDLFDEMEDVTSSWADSLDKGAGWDAMDGPISNMSARGVTGNRLPNKSEIGGRSGEGRSGKSSGEFVGDSAVGKGGRKTPSRLTPDPFEKGQVKDTSKDPVGGATGGGKESGQGGEGLEGPIPPPLKRHLARLAGRQASLRNRAETIRLQFKIANYNTERLDTVIGRMKTVEQQLRDGRVRSALRHRDVLLGKGSDLRGQLTGSSAVTTDTTAAVPKEIQKQIETGRDTPSPTGWESLNKSYFQRIAGAAPARSSIPTQKPKP